MALRMRADSRLIVTDELILDFFRCLTQDVFEVGASLAKLLKQRCQGSTDFENILGQALERFPSVTMSNGSLKPRATISCKNPFQFA